MLLRIEAGKVLDIPWVAYTGAIFSLQAVGSWNHDPANDEGSFPGGGQLMCIGCRLDSS